MLEKITDEEIEFMECFYTPDCLIESLFHQFDVPSLFSEEEFGHIRLGQYPMMSFEYLIDDDPNLTEKENFKLKENAGSVYAFGGRNYGKSLITEKLDIPIDALCNEGNKTGFSSYDAIHIKGVLDEVIMGLENHPILDNLLNVKVNRSPNYRITAANGWTLNSVNMNLSGKKPGSGFFQKHFNKLWIEEGSFETNDIYAKRLDSVDEKGCVIRNAGMTNFTKHSPVGRIFYDLKQKPWICNLPQYVNPFWDQKSKERAVKEHGGEESISYRVFVKGQVVEEGISVFDMDRVRKNYLEKEIKHFEISKDNYKYYDTLLILDKPSNVEVCYINSDIGESAPTEIIIIFKIKDKYKYTYNITLYNLTDKQQYSIIKWIMLKLEANFTGIDTTDGMGRAIYRRLLEDFSKEHLTWCSFNEKIPVDFEKDKFGNIVYKDGKPLYREEYISEWSIRRLKALLYDERMEIPMDYKFDVQFNSVVVVQSGTRTVYSCISEADHLLAAFRVFAIAQWYNEFNLVKPIKQKTFSKTGV